MAVRVFGGTSGQHVCGCVCLSLTPGLRHHSGSGGSTEDPEQEKDPPPPKTQTVAGHSNRAPQFLKPALLIKVASQLSPLTLLQPTTSGKKCQEKIAGYIPQLHTSSQLDGLQSDPK